MLTNSTIINAGLLAALSDLRHGDVVVVADAGLPVGDAARVIDLSITPGVPSFPFVVDLLLQEVVIESAIVASEAAGCAPLENVRAGLPYREVTHKEFKRLTADARLVVRTGEYTPYANVALIAGVAF